MPDKKQHKMLIDGISDWNEWRDVNPDVSIDLRQAHLIEEDLDGANLYKADLRGADLQGASLDHADLTIANLEEANLRGANLRLANMSRALFKGASLYEANLSRAILREADLREADLSEARLMYTNLSQASLTGANLRAVFLYETVFGRTKLSGTHGLEACIHLGPCVFDLRTSEESGLLPPVFLRGCGLSDTLIDYLPSLTGDAINFYSCFISYSHADKSFARRLHDQLQGKGIRCWLDEHQILPGDDFYEQIDRGIKLWDKILLCCSKHSLTSWWVDNEIDTAFEKERLLMNERNEKIISVIPLNLDDYIFSDQWESGKARQIKSRLAADFTGWESDNEKFEKALESVVKALKTDNKGHGNRPPSKL